MNPDRRTFFSLGVGALAVAAVPSALRRTPPLVRRRIPIMGTVAEIVVPSHDPEWAHAVIDDGFDALRAVERTMSRFRADSDVGRMNAAAGEWVVVSPETADVLDASLRWSIASDGRFDPCLGRTAALWDGVPTGASFPSVPGSGVEPEPSRPVWAGDPRAPVAVRWGGGAVEARVTVKGAAVDLGGIAKGFAVDQAAEALRTAGVTSGLINVGGDLVALGRAPDGGAWLVGVQDPDDPNALAATVEVADEAIATSGDYVRWFERDGRRYHHLIDPNTGEPRLTRTRSLTVRSDRCVHADAAATALFGARADVMDMIAARAPGRVRVLHEIQEETT